jgi:hypothetical protein
MATLSSYAIERDQELDAAQRDLGVGKLADAQAKLDALWDGAHNDPKYQNLHQQVFAAEMQARERDPVEVGQSIDCANDVTTESRSRTGPGGVVAVLKVHSEDDHNKNSHECEANYTLRITLPDGRDGAAGLIPPMGFTSSVAEWGRRLSVHLDGFSNDGQHIFGVISEGGKYSFVQVFDFKRDGSHVEIQIQQGLSHLKAANCGTSFAVAGTTNAGEIVLEPNTASRCRMDRRWLLNKAGKLWDLAKNESFMPLYTPRRQ